MADQDQGHPGQGDPGDVQLRGGQLQLVPDPRGRWGQVGVIRQQALAVGGEVAAQGPGIAGGGRDRQAPAGGQVEGLFQGAGQGGDARLRAPRT